MERLNKKQKEMLDILNREYPKTLPKNALFEKLGWKTDGTDVLADVKLLEEHKLIETIYGIGSGYFPTHLTITPKGKEKLQENFITKLKDSAHDNPWLVLSVIIAFASLLIVSNYYFQNINLQKEKSLLEKPLLIAPDVRVQGNSIADLKFIIKNPSYSIDYFYVSGSCVPASPDLFSQPPIDADKKQNELPDKVNTPLIVQPTKNRDIIIPAKGGEITLSCSNNYVRNPDRDTITYINICVNFRNVAESICNKMQVTVLKN